jgi:hypothetical protein
MSGSRPTVTSRPEYSGSEADQSVPSASTTRTSLPTSIGSAENVRTTSSGGLSRRSPSAGVLERSESCA